MVRVGLLACMLAYLLEDRKGKQEHEIYRKNGFSVLQEYDLNYYE